MISSEVPSPSLGSASCVFLILRIEAASFRVQAFRPATIGIEVATDGVKCDLLATHSVHTSASLVSIASTTEDQPTVSPICLPIIPAMNATLYKYTMYWYILYILYILYM